MRDRTITVLMLAMLVLCGKAKADILLSLFNAPATSGTTYSLTFTAGASATYIAFAGYQSPARLWAEDISLTSGGSNLLSETWSFIPFNPLDTTDSGQFVDGYGTGTNGLHFENGTGDTDEFFQLVNTVAGQQYTLDFLFINSVENEPSELAVSESPIPEPSYFLLLATVAAGIACNRLLKARTGAAQ